MKKTVILVEIVGGALEGNVAGAPNLPTDSSLTEIYCRTNRVEDRLGIELQFSIRSRKDSTLVTSEDRQAISEKIRQVPAGGIDAVIVVHGSDTVKETIKAGAGDGGLACPVAFVSSDKPMGEAGSDGPLMLGAAIEGLKKLVRLGANEVLLFS